MAIDLDSLCAYTTFKTVSVRHKWLGIVYYGTTIVVFAYILGWRFGVQHAYKKPFGVKGAIVASVRGPLGRITSGSPYCKQDGPASADITQHECIFADFDSGDLSKQTPGEESALFIGTRRSTTQERRDSTCAATDYTCDPWIRGEKTTNYVGALEASTLLVKHHVSAGTEDSFDRDIVDTFTPGRQNVVLEGPGDPEGKDSPKPLTRSVTTREFGDVFNISDLLYVARVDLDAQNVTDYSTGGNTSYRETGLTLRLRVIYEGSALAKADTTYKYKVSVTRLEAKLTFAETVNDTVHVEWGSADHDALPQERLLHDLHGLQLLLSQDGELAVFDLGTMLLTIFSGFAYIFVAKTVADYFLRYFAPRRKDYRLFVQSFSPDFAPDTEEERLLLEAVLRAKRQKHAALMGSGQPYPSLASQDGLTAPAAADGGNAVLDDDARLPTADSAVGTIQARPA